MSYVNRDNELEANAIVQHSKQIKRLLKISSGEAFGKVLIAVGSHRHLAGSDDISLSHARM